MNFILRNDKNHILKTKNFSIEEIINFVGYDTIYEQDYFFSGKEKILSENILDIEEYEVLSCRFGSGLFLEKYEIHVGDILFQDNKYLEVVFQDGCFSCKIENVIFPLKIAIQNHLVHNMFIEVVGNIYENGDLLK